MNPARIQTNRRTALVGAGVGVAATVAACSTYGDEPAADSSAPSAESSGTSAPGGAPAELAKTADVPVGSALIVDETVLTQPVAGEFKGFSTVCPHAGCNVAEVLETVIKCPCHGSEFTFDGAVAKGPATKPLTPKAISVQGDSIVAG